MLNVIRNHERLIKREGIGIHDNNRIDSVGPVMEKTKKRDRDIFIRPTTMPRSSINSFPDEKLKEINIAKD
ncbi:MAG TPA: hypothetical protein VEI57_01430 [Nitrospirota bacterium]|nr:hypothetical protein [Nitrospirota bacterium]